MAHGSFENYEPLGDATRASAFRQDWQRTPGYPAPVRQFRTRTWP